MRIYLDTCTIQRPVDISQEARVQREAEAVLDVVELIEARKIELVSSAVLRVEHDRNRHPMRRVFTERVLSLASEELSILPEVEQRAESYLGFGLKGDDAMHLACAVQAGVDFFCTCDDRFLRRAKKADTGLTRAVSPLELIQEVKR
jgi:predicted nucleic acid-binding protein